MRIRKNRKIKINNTNKKSNKSLLSFMVCTISILLSLAVTAGCSGRETVPTETQSETQPPTQSESQPPTQSETQLQTQQENEKNQLEQMEGKWKIDFEKTDPTLWGTGVSAGNDMEISATGEFSYYIGIGVGGTGQCENKDSGITVEIEPYEEHSSEKEILVLKYVNENEAEYILMNWHDEDVYWKRDSSSGDGAE